MTDCRLRCYLCRLFDLTSLVAIDNDVAIYWLDDVCSSATRSYSTRRTGPHTYACLKARQIRRLPSEPVSVVFLYCLMCPTWIHIDAERLRFRYGGPMKIYILNGDDNHYTYFIIKIFSTQ